MKIFYTIFMGLTMLALLVSCAPEKVQTRVVAAGQNIAEETEEAKKSADERAVEIATEAEKINGVEDAACVVTGNTAILGITLTEDLDDPQLVALKRRVEKTVKEFDPQIDHVAVSSAPDLYDRIKAIFYNNKKEEEMDESATEKNEKKPIFFQLIPAI